MQLVPQPVIPVGAVSQVQLSSGGCTLIPPKYEFFRSVCDFCICKSLVVVIKLLIYNYTQQKNLKVANEYNEWLCECIVWSSSLQFG